MTPDDSLSPFRLEKLLLSDKKTTVSVPENALPSIKLLLLRVKEQTLYPEEQWSDAWEKWHHRIGNAAQSMMKSALFEESEEVQEQKFIKITKEIIEAKGQDIIPFLDYFGFPVKDLLYQ